MEKFKLNDMINGWFIGNFEPSLFKTNDVEVAVKKYSSGDKEASHFHKIATEFTIILVGSALMNQKIYEPGDIVVIRPGEETDFCALTDLMTVVVKIPGANNDKFII
jgi:hypothetical protein